MRVDFTGQCVDNSNNYISADGRRSTKPRKSDVDGRSKIAPLPTEPVAPTSKRFSNQSSSNDKPRGTAAANNAPASKRFSNQSSSSNKPTGTAPANKAPASKRFSNQSSSNDKPTGSAKTASTSGSSRTSKPKSSGSLTVPRQKRKHSGIMNEKRESRIMTSAGEIIEVESPYSLVLVWVLVATELGLDLVTSGIAFTSFMSESRHCCGEKINSGAIPLGSTIPFFVLVIAELLFLLRAIFLTLWPDPAMAEADIEENRGCCRCNWTSTFMMLSVNFLTIINPFFGCGIAWMLLYLSDKNEALIVMGLETATVILHFLCVYLEKAAKTLVAKLMHSIIIIPWLATVAVNVWYLNKGGVCYETALETFWYKGCEICPNGMRPVNDTLCPTTTLVDGVNQTTYKAYKLWELDAASSCGGDNDVCWFPY